MFHYSLRVIDEPKMSEIWILNLCHKKSILVDIYRQSLLNTEQPNFLPLLFSQPENKNQKYLHVISKKTQSSISKKFMIISPRFVRRRLCDINIQSLLLLSGHFKNFHYNSWSRVGQNCLKTKNKVTLTKTLHTRMGPMPRT